MNKKGMSLAIASAMMVIIFSLSMVSLSMVMSNANRTRALIAKEIVTNRTEDGFPEAVQKLRYLVEDGWEITELPVYTGALKYDLIGDVMVKVTIRDNNDLDDSTEYDTDKLYILTSTGYIVDDPTKAANEQDNIAESTIEYLVRYVGDDDEYAQETGNSAGDNDKENDYSGHGGTTSPTS